MADVHELQITTLPQPRGHVQSVLDGVTLGTTQRAEGWEPCQWLKVTIT